MKIYLTLVLQFVRFKCFFIENPEMASDAF